MNSEKCCDREAPCCACRVPLDDMPLAIAYVPRQQWDKTYEASVALTRGTLFPALDLPFCAVKTDSTCVADPNLMRTVMETSFAVDDIQLYLNTHPCDRTAFSAFKRYLAARSRAVAAYEAMCGPLTIGGLKNADCYEWIEHPWPWEVDF